MMQAGSVSRLFGGPALYYAWLRDVIREDVLCLDTSILAMVAVGIVFTGFGVGLVSVAIASRRERAEIRARGERPGWRNTSPGCLLALAVPLLLLGLILTLSGVSVVVSG